MKKVVKKTRATKVKAVDSTSKDKSAAVALCEKVVDELFGLIGIKSKADVLYDKESDSINVSIKSEEEAGLLIGKKGETVNSLQKFLSLTIRKATGEWHRILVNVADWREKQTARLEELASQAARRARETGEPQNLYNLSSGQRRIIHLFLSEEKDVKTESVGEGEERYLVISTNK